MRAFRVTGPSVGGVVDLPDPSPDAGEVLVRVARAGLCGTDRDLFDGGMRARLGDAIRLPLTLGHEWSGRVERIGAGVDPDWIGRRVTGDTFIGCGACRQCRIGLHQTCPARAEVGVRGRDGALAELVRVPAGILVPLPDAVDDAAGALVEPASNAVRAIAELRGPTDSVLVLGAGTLGLLAGRVVAARGGRAVLVDADRGAVARARALGAEAAEPDGVAAGEGFDGAVNMSPAPGAEAWLLSRVRDGAAVVTVGFAAGPSSVDARTLAERDLRVVGTLGAPQRLARTATLIGEERLRVDDLTGGPVGLDDVGGVLAGWGAPRPHPKTQADPRIRPSSRAG